MHQANLFFHSNGMPKPTKQMLSMQLKVWAPQGKLVSHRPRPEKKDLGYTFHPAPNPRGVRGFLLPSLAEWRSFFEEKMQVGPN